MLDRLKSLFESIERKESSGGPPEYIIAGLGNPGRKYEGTRHNAGYMALDRLADIAGARAESARFKSLCTFAMVSNKKVLLLKPQTFMNLSGDAIGEAAGFYKIPMSHVIVIHDDVALAPGRIRVREKGSDGGHNGIKNIISRTGTEVFPRVKIGVGMPPGQGSDLISWVLGHFPPEQAAVMESAFQNAALAVQEIIANGTGSAMNLYNGVEKSI